MKLSSRLHAWVYRRSGGRLLSRMGGQGVLLLTTTGRATAMSWCSWPRVAAPRPPEWFANLRLDPSESVQIGAERRALTARVAEGEERARLWDVLTRANHRL